MLHCHVSSPPRFYLRGELHFGGGWTTVDPGIALVRYAASEKHHPNRIKIKYQRNFKVLLKYETCGFLDVGREILRVVQNFCPYYYVLPLRLLLLILLLMLLLSLFHYCY